MRILQLNNIQNTNFKSGLTAQILERESCIVPKQVENYFKNSPYNCNYYNFKNLDLKDNKAYALALRMCAEIFKNFSRNHNYSGYSYLKPKVFPSDIIVYNRDNLPDNMDSSKKDEFMKAFHTIGSYVPWSGTVIKNLKSSINIGSILIPNSIKKLEQLNEISDINKKEGFHSSGHFLSIFIHEWIHSIADYYLYQASDGGGKYDATLRAVKQKRLNDRENEIVRDILGDLFIFNILQHKEIKVGMIFVVQLFKSLSVSVFCIVNYIDKVTFLHSGFLLSLKYLRSFS